MMGVCWSADHRVVDGATMARAAKVVQALLEEPLKMMLEMS
jgi:2-oxoisovalerate dehydrogenase E2 component (dihydrolipoyl transacylase)